MSHVLIPTSSLALSIFAPDPGDRLLSAATDAPLQTLLNNDYFMSASMFSVTGTFTPNTITRFTNYVYLSGSAIVPGGQYLEFDSGGELLLEAGAKTFNLSGSLTQFYFGSQEKYYSGATSLFQAGATLTVQSGAELDIQGTAIVESGAIVEVTGTLDSVNGTLHIAGGTTTLMDNNPILFKTAVSRTIVQPFNVRGAAVGASGRNYFTDTAQNVTWYISCEKMFNGATLDSVLLPFYTQGTAPAAGSSNQTVTLWKTNRVNGADSQIGSAVTINNGLSTNFYTALGWSSLNETIDDSSYSYSLQIVSTTSTQAVIWYAPVLSFTNITSLRSS